MLMIFVEPDGTWVLERSHPSLEVMERCIETLLASGDAVDWEYSPDTTLDGQFSWGLRDVH